MNKKHIVIFILLSVSQLLASTVKMSTAHLNFKDGDGSLVFTFFLDDFQEHLSLKYNKEIKLNAEGEFAEILNSYVNEKFVLEINGKPQQIKYEGLDFLEKNRVDVDFSFTYHGHVKQVMVENKLLFDAFENQSNLVYVSSEGNRRQILRFTKEDFKKSLEY